MGLTWGGIWASRTLLWRHPKGSGSLLSLAGVLGTLQPRETPASCWRVQNFSSSVWVSLLIHFFIFFQLHISSWSTLWREAVCGQERCWQSHAHQGKQLSPLLRVTGELSPCWMIPQYLLCSSVYFHAGILMYLHLSVPSYSDARVL